MDEILLEGLALVHARLALQRAIKETELLRLTGTTEPALCHLQEAKKLLASIKIPPVVKTDLKKRGLL